MTKRIIAARYTLQDELGAGGMGKVYRGTDAQNGTTVAVKQLRSDLTTPEMLERFQREGEALRELDHPNIVKMLDTVEEDDQHFLVMEYVSGGDLKDRIEANGRLDHRRCVDMAIDLADALTRAHRLDIIHRDLKPANVLIAEDGTLKLTDFGVAHIGSRERVTDTDGIVGTMDYLPPEAFNTAAYDARGDIWAFGVMLFEMLSGERPFTGPSIAQVIYAITSAPIPDLEALCPDAPTALIDLIYRMLERDPNARISSVRYVGAALEDILHGREHTPQPRQFETPIPDVYVRPKHNLPAQTTPFVGREGELTELERLLTDPAIRLITILGPGGMGKTRLALEAAARALDHFGDGVYLVELTPLSDPQHIVTAIAEATGYVFQAEARSPKQQLLDYLREKSLLLVLDNFEHLLDGAGIVTDVLSAAPGVQVLATSRTRLSQTGETLFHLTGMDFPDWETPEDALEYAAVKLFMNSAQRSRPDFELTGDNLDYIARICRLVQGMPLGIVLAASWLAVLSPQEIANEIATGIDFLETDETELPERQRSIRVVMDYSWQQMTEAEQAVFAKLSVFRGGFTREAAGEVAGANLRLLMSLTNKSLIRRDADSGRYEIHELLRQYAADKARVVIDITSVERVYAAYFAQWMHSVWSHLPGEALLDAKARAKQDFENLRSAWHLNVSHLLVTPIMQMQEYLWLYCHLTNRFDDAIELYNEAGNALATLAADSPDARANHARVQAKKCMAMVLVGRDEEANQLIEMTKQTLGELDIVDGFTEFMLVWMGWGKTERYVGARQAIDHFTENDPHNPYLLDMYTSTAAIAVDLGHFDEAVKLRNDARNVIDYSNLWSRSWYHLYSVYVHKPLEKYNEAMADLQYANQLFHKTGDLMGMYFSNRHSGAIASAMDRTDWAIAYWANALQVLLAHSLKKFVPETTLQLCKLLIETDEAALAAQVYNTAWQSPELHALMMDATSEFPDDIRIADQSSPANGLTLQEAIYQICERYVVSNEF